MRRNDGRRRIEEAVAAFDDVIARYADEARAQFRQVVEMAKAGKRELRKRS